MQHNNIKSQAMVMPPPAAMVFSDKGEENTGVSAAKSTRGTKAFDLTVYAGINWLGNAALSVFIAHKFFHGSWRPTFDKAVNYMDHGAFTPLSKALPGLIKDPRAAAEYNTKVLTLMTGGYSVMAPIKWLEDAKVPIVKRLDSMMYDDDPQTRAMLEQAHAELEKEPKQSWGSVLGGRTLALAGVWALTIPYGHQLNEKLFKPVTKYTARIVNPSGNPTVNHILNLGVEDFALSGYCAGLFYGITRVWHHFTGEAAEVSQPPSEVQSVEADGRLVSRAAAHAASRD